MFEYFYTFAFSFWETLSEFANEFSTWLITPEQIGVAEYAPFELMFGSAFFSILTYGLIKFVLDIWPG